MLATRLREAVLRANVECAVCAAADLPAGHPEHDKVVGEGFYGAMSSLKRNCACGKRGDGAPLKKSTIDDDGVTVETGLRSPSPGPSASTKVKVTPGIDETDL